MMRTGVLVIISLAILGYISVGVYIFTALEADFEIQRQKNLLRRLEIFLGKLALIRLNCGLSLGVKKNVRRV